MRREELVEIGFVKRAHGLQGELKIKITDFYKPYLPEFSILVMEKGEDFLPFFVQSLQESSTEPIILFESIQSKEEASQWIGKKLYALQNELPEVYENEMNTLVGYFVLDQNDLSIGQVQEVLEMPSQILLSVKGAQGELMIPFHEDLILSIDMDEEIIKLELPDGFLAIFD